MTVRRRPVRLLMTAAATALVVPLAGWGAGTALSQDAGEAASGSSGGTNPSTTRADSKQQAATLTGIELKPGDSSHDRVVFHFADKLTNDRLPQYDVEYLGGYPHQPGSGKPVEMEGQLFLGVSFTHATTDGSVPEVLDKGLPTVAEVRYLGGFEKVQEAAIGVSGCHGAPEKPDFDVKVLDTDIVVDVNRADCGSEEPVTRQCGDVAFEPETDSGAFGITATGVGCETARDVAAFAEGMVGEPYGTPSGFSCLPERDDSQPTPSINYTCIRGDAEVTFTTG